MIECRRQLLTKTPMSTGLTIYEFAPVLYDSSISVSEVEVQQFSVNSICQVHRKVL